jgi:hypothetical protein
MEKAIFNYTKEGETTPSNRTLIKPKFLKEATNSLKDFEKTDVKYVRGYELNKADLNRRTRCVSTNKHLEDYEDAYPTLQEFLTEKGLDYS